MPPFREFKGNVYRAYKIMLMGMAERKSEKRETRIKKKREKNHR